MFKSKRGKLFLIVLALGNMIVMGPGACGEMTDGFNNHHPTPMAKPWVPPSQRGDLTVEQENELLAQIEFSLTGTPAGETAVFLGDTIVSRLSPGDTTRISIDGQDRCNLVLKVPGEDGEWTQVKALGCIDHTPYAGVGFDVEGYEAKTSWHAWK
jgi:hypothetical protein